MSEQLTVRCLICGTMTIVGEHFVCGGGVHISQHAMKRIKQRFGLGRKPAARLVRQARIWGMSRSVSEGREIVAWKDKVFVFEGSRCITAYRRAKNHQLLFKDKAL